MPVIVIGADTETGHEIAKALTKRDGEVRAFVTDPSSADRLRSLGVKVAIGDVSDASHIDGAARRAFAAVLIAECGRDGRERAFASSFDAVVEAWAEGLRGAGVHRLIWVGPGARLPTALGATAPEAAVVDTEQRSLEEIATEVSRLDDLATLGADASPG